jgi:hypothetical protein
MTQASGGCQRCRPRGGLVAAALVALRSRPDARADAIDSSSVNQVVSKRRVMKQQMRWAPKSAHLLLQVRTKALNDELGEVFRRWYPAFDAPTESLVMEESAAQPPPVLFTLVHAKNNRVAEEPNAAKVARSVLQTSRCRKGAA